MTRNCVSQVIASCEPTNAIHIIRRFRGLEVFQKQHGHDEQRIEARVVESCVAVQTWTESLGANTKPVSIAKCAQVTFRRFQTLPSQLGIGSRTGKMKGETWQYSSCSWNPRLVPATPPTTQMRSSSRVPASQLAGNTGNLQPSRSTQRERGVSRTQNLVEFSSVTRATQQGRRARM